MSILPETRDQLTWRIGTAGARLVCIDGPAGSGKTTLADVLAEVLHAPIVHMDDLYEGWEAGPGGGVARLREWVLDPLAAGHQASYRRYDWEHGAWAHWHTLPSSPHIIVEGCGAAARQVDEFPGGAFRIWVEASEAERLRRGLQRDGEQARNNWLQWMKDEATHFAQENTKTRADAHLNGLGTILPAPSV